MPPSPGFHIYHDHIRPAGIYEWYSGAIFFDQAFAVTVGLLVSLFHWNACTACTLQISFATCTRINVSFSLKINS